MKFINNTMIKANAGENPINESYLPKNSLLGIDIFRYPDPLCEKVRQKIADYVGCSANNILCTNGSDEALVLLIRNFTLPEDEVIICPPTFFMFKHYANIARSKVVSVERKKDFSLDMDKILASITERTKMIIIDSPGNPCGETIAKKDIEMLLKENIIVVVDEAYYEYCHETVIDLIRTSPNLIITRTFSKWAGLAGLRVGYVVARENIINELLSLKLPYNVNAFGQELASYVLDHKKVFLERLQSLISLRDYAIKKLREISNIEVYPSKTAYIIIKFTSNMRAQEIQKSLEEDKIFVKFVNEHLLKNCIRVNLGTTEEFRRFYYSFNKILLNYNL